ncbi:ATP-binding cassette domain-containing protein [Psychrilyobacter atlanticus]|uniref:ATP-binding cassette domain-containing protein n=1 Tax=Psychrilyobacter atlanticus TaxID=271091 RepID=UPI0003F7E001|nr:ABC transporter ATP-binding protein [Psychrilyobacter atlanticus]
MKTYIYINIFKNLFYVFLGAISQPLIAFAYTLINLDKNNLDNTVITIIKTILPLIILGVLVSGISYIGKSNISNEILNRVRKDLFKNILNTPLNKFYEKDSGEYYNIILKKVETWKNRTFDQTFNIIQNCIEISFLFILVFNINFIGGIVCLIFLIPLILNNLIFPKKIDKMFRAYLNKYDSLITSTKEYLSGFEIIKISSLNEIFLKKFNKVSDDINVEEKKIDFVCNLSGIIANTCVVLSQISGILISIYLYITKNITFGELLALIQIVFFLNEPVIKLINSIISYNSNKSLNTELETILKNNQESIDSDIKISAINFVDTSYKYKEKNINTINKFNKVFFKNKKYLITGKSGSGKTTLFNLIVGKIMPTQGGIFVNEGIPSINALKNNIFVVSQNNFIFNDTIKNNIDIHEKYSENEVLEVIEKVHLTELVYSKKEKLNSIINDEVVKISAGEKARIGLARAMLSSADVILIDEALASLDNNTAINIEKLILEITNKMVIHISHKSNLDYIKQYDEVIKLA